MKHKQFLIPTISLAILMCLSGCATSTDANLNLCNSYRLITVSPQDKLTPTTAKAILHDDDQYEAICH
jgi:hypothetical protein